MVMLISKIINYLLSQPTLGLVVTHDVILNKLYITKTQG